MLEGFRRLGRRLLGVDASPKLLYSPYETGTAETYYAGMDKYYREYRRDALVRGCINSLAYFSTAKGFQTATEPESRELKEHIDRINGQVNLDQALYTAIVKAKVYGKAGFEIVRNPKGEPVQLLPLQSESLKPKLDEDWRLTDFDYKGHIDYYAPEEVLYFTNNSLEADMEGLSDVEPVYDSLQTRRLILQEALKESAKVLWAGIGIHTIDTSGLSDSEAEQIISEFIRQLKPGKHIANNQKVTSQIVDLKPNLGQLVSVLDYLDTEIIGSFRVPRFMIGRERQVNRATSYTELEAFVNGPIAGIQRWLKRELEAQWYGRLARIKLNLSLEDPPPITVKHLWNPISTADAQVMAQLATQLFGLGAIDKTKLWELMGWDPSEIEEEKKEGEGEN